MRVQPNFRDIEPERPNIISKAKEALGKFFSKLIGKNGGTIDVPKPEEVVEKVDDELEKVQMPKVEVVDQRRSPLEGMSDH